LILRNPREIEIIQKKLHRILFDESIHPNKYEQHITQLREYLVAELECQRSFPIEKEKTPFNDFLIQKKKLVHRNKDMEPER